MTYKSASLPCMLQYLYFPESIAVLARQTIPGVTPLLIAWPPALGHAPDCEVRVFS